MNLGNYETEAKLFKALNHPVRLAILEILREDEACVCHMEAHLGLRQAYISQQLMILREAGLVQDRRDGLNIFYRVIEPDIFTVLDAMRLITGVDETAPSGAFAREIGISACDCPKCTAAVGVPAVQGHEWRQNARVS
jgi:DNA-binding transcriptional ArsR family regulator